MARTVQRPRRPPKPGTTPNFGAAHPDDLGSPRGHGCPGRARRGAGGARPRGRGRAGRRRGDRAARGARGHGQDRAARRGPLAGPRAGLRRDDGVLRRARAGLRRRRGATAPRAADRAARAGGPRGADRRRARRRRGGDARAAPGGRRGARRRSRAFAACTACGGSARALQERAPLLLCVDDAQWCDAWSAHALVYLARRLAGLRVGDRHDGPRGDPGAEIDALHEVPASCSCVLPALSPAATARILGQHARRPLRRRGPRGGGRQPVPRRRARRVGRAEAGATRDGGAARVSCPTSVARRVDRTLRALPDPAARDRGGHRRARPGGAARARRARRRRHRWRRRRRAPTRWRRRALIEPRPSRCASSTRSSSRRSRSGLGPGEARVLHARAAAALGESAEPDGRVAAHLLRAQPARRAVGGRGPAQRGRAGARGGRADAGGARCSSARSPRACPATTPSCGCCSAAPPRAHRPDAVERADRGVAVVRAGGPALRRSRARARPRAGASRVGCPRPSRCSTRASTRSPTTSADVASMESELLGAMRFDARRTAARSTTCWRGPSSAAGAATRRRRLLLSHRAHAAATAARPADEIRELALAVVGRRRAAARRGPEAAEIYNVLYALLWAEALDEARGDRRAVLEEAAAAGLDRRATARRSAGGRRCTPRAATSPRWRPTRSPRSRPTRTARWIDRPLAELLCVRAPAARGEVDEAERVLRRAEAADGRGRRSARCCAAAAALVAAGARRLDAARAMLLRGGVTAAEAWGSDNPNVFPWRTLAVTRARAARADRRGACGSPREELDAARRRRDARGDGPRAARARARPSPPAEARALLDGGDPGARGVAGPRSRSPRRCCSPAMLLRARAAAGGGARAAAARARRGARVRRRRARGRRARRARRRGRPAARRAAMSGSDALTAAERRVAALAAEGLGNREIAQALFLTSRRSRRT